MKKYLKIIIGLTLVSLIGYLGYSISSKINHKNEVAKRIQSVPVFTFKTLNGEPFTQNEISTAQPKLFIYFNSDCEFCQSEAEQLSKKINLLKNIQIIMVSFEPIEGIKDFAKKYQLLKHKNIVFLHDENLLFEDIFDVNSIPFILLYSKENQLIQKFKGATKIENIVALLPPLSADRRDSQKE